MYGYAGGYGAFNYHGGNNNAMATAPIYQPNFYHTPYMYNYNNMNAQRNSYPQAAQSRSINPDEYRDSSSQRRLSRNEEKSRKGDKEASSPQKNKSKSKERKSSIYNSFFKGKSGKGSLPVAPSRDSEEADRKTPRDNHMNDNNYNNTYDNYNNYSTNRSVGNSYSSAERRRGTYPPDRSSRTPAVRRGSQRTRSNMGSTMDLTNNPYNYNSLYGGNFRIDIDVKPMDEKNAPSKSAGSFANAGNESKFSASAFNSFYSSDGSGDYGSGYGLSQKSSFFMLDGEDADQQDKTQTADASKAGGGRRSVYFNDISSRRQRTRSAVTFVN
ncbi:hypothetical protein AGDE_13231 [Angomonas deanei]|uniref:Uncharacterized protein n=1 Tax=Angomonas deanei TaxID=59799 RepID=A0A7G2CNI8_9TRYP|nr:hypothetical protein AGDE_13231 [Angomonas deanei]CAD2221418.1 hypothetical protein, conserved [Angomonas deanei]|eukprot:EPY22591.1 hypothetical protein AGDE_13231 [Angomonas deanei]